MITEFRLISMHRSLFIVDTLLTPKRTLGSRGRSSTNRFVSTAPRQRSATRLAVGGDDRRVAHRRSNERAVAQRGCHAVYRLLARGKSGQAQQCQHTRAPAGLRAQGDGATDAPVTHTPSHSSVTIAACPSALALRPSLPSLQEAALASTSL